MQDKNDSANPADQVPIDQNLLAGAGAQLPLAAQAQLLPQEQAQLLSQVQLLPQSQLPPELVPEHSQEASDEYLARFDVLSDCNQGLAQIVAGFGSQPDDQQRLYAVMNYVSALQKQNEHLYDLLVEMNNYFGGK